MKFNRGTGYLVVTNVPIKQEDEILEYTNKFFIDMVIEKMEELKKDPIKNLVELAPYKKFGFMDEEPTLKRVK